jgi:hypothetical protein
VDVPTLLVKGTRAWEAAAAAEVAHVTVVLAVETSAQEVVASQDSTALHVKDAEDQATWADREALERVSRVEAGNTTTLAFACEYVEGFVQKIAVLKGELAAERRAREVFETES